jgi:hypothetical protein
VIHPQGRVKGSGRGRPLHTGFCSTRERCFRLRTNLAVRLEKMLGDDEANQDPARWGRYALPTAEQADPQSLVCAGLRRFGSGWRCASWRGTASRGTSSKGLRASPSGRRLRTRIPFSWIAEASAEIRCPSHSRGSVRSLLTFLLVLLRSRPARWLKLDDRRSDEGPAGRDRQTPKSATEHAWAGIVLL